MSYFGEFPGVMSQQHGGSSSVAEVIEEQEFDDDEVAEVDTNLGPGADEGVTLYYQLRRLSKEFAVMKQENESIRTVVFELQNDRDKLRNMMRSLKMENNRFKAKLKRMTEAMKSSKRRSTTTDNNTAAADGDVAMDGNDKDEGVDKDISFDDDDDLDYDDIGDFLLIGGPNDPLSIQYRSSIKDAAGVEHKSVERYVWYKMAETFNDQESMEKILKAGTPSAAEEATHAIKDLDVKTWDAVKMRHWEDGQRLKFEQYRRLKCLLVKTGKSYLAVASQDKVYGTGWRKQRDEAAQPRMWDGENRGGKCLMKLRDEYAAVHVWTSPNEEIEARNTVNENRANVWRKTKRTGGGFGGGGGGRGGNRNNAVGAAPRPFPAAAAANNNRMQGQARGPRPSSSWSYPTMYNNPNGNPSPMYVGHNRASLLSYPPNNQFQQPRRETVAAGFMRRWRF